MTRAADKDFCRGVSARLALTRAVVGLTQKDFAEIAGMRRNHYNMIENSGRPLHIEDAVRLCHAHDLSLDWIYLGDTAGLRHEMADALKALRVARRGSAARAEGAPA